MRVADALALALAASLAAAPARAESPDPAARRLGEVERALDAVRAREQMIRADGEALARELAELRLEAVAVAESVAAAENRVAALEAAREAAASEAARRLAALADRRERLAVLLLGLERLARTPAETVLLRPGSPLETARAARLLAAAVPAVEAEAAALRAELAALDAAQARVAVEEAALAAGRAVLAADSVRLAALIDRRAALLRETERERAEARARAVRLSREAADLRDLGARVAAERAARALREREEAALPSLEAAAGRLRLPVTGRVILAWGQPGEGGQPHRGLTIAAVGDATVVAPWDGIVAFAGPFRGYGVVLILQHSDGYHSLIAGLGRLDVAPGQAVAAGEPVGRTVADGNARPAVYLELRRNGQPIDPHPWLAAPNGKVSG